jgi:hypothetical protein
MLKAKMLHLRLGTNIFTIVWIRTKLFKESTKICQDLWRDNWKILLKLKQM